MLQTVRVNTILTPPLSHLCAYQYIFNDSGRQVTGRIKVVQLSACTAYKAYHVLLKVSRKLQTNLELLNLNIAYYFTSVKHALIRGFH